MGTRPQFDRWEAVTTDHERLICVKVERHGWIILQRVDLGDHAAPLPPVRLTRPEWERLRDCVEEILAAPSFTTA